MEGSPFNRSGLTRRSPPPTPSRPPPCPLEEQEEPLPPLVVVPTPDVNTWMSKIERLLSEVCAISAEGKLNSDQKLRISNLCRKVSHTSSELAVQYQSLKYRSIETHRALERSRDFQDLTKQFQQLQDKIESKPAPTAVSFADMVKKSATSFIQPKNISSVAIFPTDKSQSSEETKIRVQKLIRPEELKLHVVGLRKTRNGGVIISTDSKEDVEKLKQSSSLTSSGFTVDEPHKRRPRIEVIGIPASMPEIEVLKCIYHQNLAEKLQNTSLDKCLSELKISHKSGRRDAKTCNYVIEVSPIIRKTLISNDKIFINWTRCYVRDFTLVTRCYRCQQFGHAAKTCRAEVDTCGHCGEVGHSIKDCGKKDGPPKCATCMHFKKPSSHKTGDPDCPARKLAEQRYINTIDYDGA